MLFRSVEGLNPGREDAKERIVRFRAYDYFIAINRAKSGAQYDRLQAGLDRLAIRIKTNIMTGKVRIKENFGIIDWWRIVEKSADDSKMVLLVAGFEVQDCWPAHGQGQLHGFTHDAASMVALS